MDRWGALESGVHLLYFSSSLESPVQHYGPPRGSHKSGRNCQSDVTLNLICGWSACSLGTARHCLWLAVQQFTHMVQCITWVSLIGLISWLQTTPGQTLECAFQGARRRMSGSWSSLSSYGGSEGVNTQLSHVATKRASSERLLQ